MFSLQKLLGKEDKFFTLLEASAEEARASVQALVKLSKSLEKVIDRCRDAGNVIAHIVLKNS